MGHKVNPIGFRLGVIKEHNSVWYADKKEYAKNLLNDIQVREFLDKRLVKASVSKIVIERPAQNARITIHTARPGIVIGKKGEDVDRLRREVGVMMGVPVHINIEEVRKPDLDARLVAQNVAGQLERRVMFRLAVVSGELKLPVPSGIAKVVFRCTHYVQILITEPTKRIPLTA